MRRLDVVKPNKIESMLIGWIAYQQVIWEIPFTPKQVDFVFFSDFLLLGILRLHVQDIKRNIVVCLQCDLFWFLTAKYYYVLSIMYNRMI